MKTNIKGLEIFESKIKSFKRVDYNESRLGTLCRTKSGKWIYTSRVGSFDDMIEAAESLLRYRCVCHMGLSDKALILKCRKGSI